MDTTNNNLKVYILDDDYFYLMYVSSIIEKSFKGIKTSTFNSRTELINRLSDKPDLIVLDYHLGDENNSYLTAHSVIEEIENIHPDQLIVLISGEPTLPLLEEYQKFRKYDFLVKGENITSEIKTLLSSRFNINH